MKDIQQLPTQQLLVRGWTHEMNTPAGSEACGAVDSRERRPGLGRYPPTMTNTNPSTSDQYSPVESHSVSVPSDLTSDGTKLVYLYLQVRGESTLEELNQSLEMKSISLLPILNTLQSKELVDRQDEYYLPTAA